MKTKIMKTIGFGILSISIFTGCVSDNPSVSKVEELNNSSTLPFSKVCEIPVKGKKVKAPAWVCNGGNIKGYITATGSAPKSNWGYSFQRNVALTQARAEISRELKVKVKDMITNYMSETGNKNATINSKAVDGNLEQITKSITASTLKGSKIIDTWFAPDETLFILVGCPIDKNRIKNETTKVLSSSYKNQNALWQKFQSEQAEKKLDKAIDKAFDEDVNPFESTKTKK